MYRTGVGYDVHKLAPDRDLILGGLKIDYSLGLVGHSDADVLTHAIIDAILGAACMGDIGQRFPDTDEKYRDISSLSLLRTVVDELPNYEIINIDAIVVAQKPKLASYMNSIRTNLTRIVKTPYVNIKATTTEKLGFEGRCEGISAHAICTLRLKLQNDQY